ncbi:mechanosensitive ion channel family protein [Proteobacteria bacterium 005FR1]|nr:mechanosensitive ion channel family protein [Proteobacteria bacterium 005FR1]
MIDSIVQAINYELIAHILRAALLLLAGFVIATLASRTAFRLMMRRVGEHHATLFRRIIYWGLLALFMASALREMGFNLGVLLGAAGVLTVAVGFASQTSASNLISGLFMVGERPFQVGDVIRIGTTTGEVLSIDLLSVKLRTFDNLFVRIPNETLIKTELTNLTRFPIRRFDLLVGVAYKESIDHVREVLERVANDNPLCLDEPAPLFMFLGFGESSLNLQFSIWTQRQNFLELRNTMHKAVKEAFDAEGIEIPFPHRTIYTGSVTDPFPIRSVSPKGSEQDQPEESSSK